MLKIIFPLFLGGFIIGKLLRNSASAKKIVPSALNLVIFVLLFFLGISVGSNRNLLEQIPSLCTQAVILTIGGIAGSLLFAYLLQKKGDKAKENKIQFSKTEILSSLKSFSGSFLILLFFCIGLTIAVLGFVPSFLVEHDMSIYTLYLLMTLVGMQMGLTRKLGEKLRQQPKRYLLLPLATIVGTLAGTAVVSIFISERSIFDSMAVGSGFAYYSLSSVIISESISPEWGSVALMANILRELSAICLAPLFIKLGPLCLISIGGATTMDTTLPTNIKYCGTEYAALSAFHGFTVDLSVPFLVTLFCLL